MPCTLREGFFSETSVTERERCASSQAKWGRTASRRVGMGKGRILCPPRATCGLLWLNVVLNVVLDVV